jgi:hypothetical protein
VGLILLGLVLAALSVAIVPRSFATTVSTADDSISKQTVQADVPMPIGVHVDASTSGCENAPGPTVTLSGELALAGLGVQMTFQNNVKGTHQHTETTTATAILIPAGESLSIPKQPVLGGTGGNPFIWVQFMDANGNAMSDEIFLGRCVQGLFATDANFVIPALATADITGGTCDNTGSTISLSGELSLSGVNAQIIFRNNDNPVGGPHQNDQAVKVSVVLIPAGMSIEFAKQPPLGGVGGNPWIYLEFLSASGDPVSDNFLLGRCVQDF